MRSLCSPGKSRSDEDVEYRRRSRDQPRGQYADAVGSSVPDIFLVSLVYRRVMIESLDVYLWIWKSEAHAQRTSKGPGLGYAKEQPYLKQLLGHLFSITPISVY